MRHWDTRSPGRPPPPLPPPAVRGARPGPARPEGQRHGAGRGWRGWDGTGLGTTARPGTAQPARGGMGEASLPCPCAWGAQGVAAPEAKWPVPLRGAAGGCSPVLASRGCLQAHTGTQQMELNTAQARPPGIPEEHSAGLGTAIHR